MDKSEWGRIKNLLNSSCAGLVIAPWTAAPQLGAIVTTPVATSPATTSTATATTAKSTPTTTNVPAQVGVSVYPGAWCKPEGATGMYTNGKSYVCAKTNASGVAYSDGRARWRRG